MNVFRKKEVEVNIIRGYLGTIHYKDGTIQSGEFQIDELEKMLDYMLSRLQNKEIKKVEWKAIR